MATAPDLHASPLSRGFAVQWAETFRDVLPLGWDLRAAFPDRWVRFHALGHPRQHARTLPGQRKYLDRASALGNVLFGSGAPIWVTMHDHGPSYADWIGRLSAEKLLTWRDPTDEENDPSHDVYVATALWGSETVEALLRNVARDRVRAVLTDHEVTRAFAPYDLGFDVIWTAEATQDLRRRFGSWLSSRPDGL